MMLGQSVNEKQQRMELLLNESLLLGLDVLIIATRELVLPLHST
jgi:hypothetical protein